MELDDYYTEDSVTHAPDEIYDDYELTPIVDSEGGPTLEYVFNNCVVPVVFQFMGTICPSLVFGVLYRFLVLKLGPRYEECVHLFSMLSGVIILIWMFGELSTIMTLVFAPCCYSLIILAHSRRSQRIYLLGVIMCLLFMILREYLPGTGEVWSRIRGVYMIMIMKTLSVVYELSNRTMEPRPRLTTIFGYLYFPGTVLFGPFIRYEAYMKSTDRRNVKMDFTVWLLSAFDFCTSFFHLIAALIMSNCGFYWLFSGFDSVFISAMESSMSVRFSHYFISLTSEALLILCGVWLSMEGELVRVVHPSEIEVPRSLVEVVVYWNIPMHKWLKCYIYTPLAHLGSGPAAILTFLVSAMLHGLSFPVSAVLLSLAVYAHIEYSFRKLLAKHYSACIGVRECGHRCTHKYKSGKLIIRLLNFLFSVLALFHLNYLGVMLETNANDEQGHTSVFQMWGSHLEAWRKLHYVSHSIAMFTFTAHLSLQIFTMFNH